MTTSTVVIRNAPRHLLGYQQVRDVLDFQYSGKRASPPHFGFHFPSPPTPCPCRACAQQKLQKRTEPALEVRKQFILQRGAGELIRIRDLSAGPPPRLPRDKDPDGRPYEMRRLRRHPVSFSLSLSLSPPLSFSLSVFLSLPMFVLAAAVPSSE